MIVPNLRRIFKAKVVEVYSVLVFPVFQFFPDFSTGCSQIWVANCMEIVFQLLFDQMLGNELIKYGIVHSKDAFTLPHFSNFPIILGAETPFDLNTARIKQPWTGNLWNHKIVEWFGWERRLKINWCQLLPWAGIFSTPSLEHSQGFLISRIWGCLWWVWEEKWINDKKFLFFSPFSTVTSPFCFTKAHVYPFFVFPTFVLLTLGSMDVVLWDLMARGCLWSAPSHPLWGGPPFEQKSSDLSNIPIFFNSLCSLSHHIFPWDYFQAGKFLCSERWLQFPIAGNFWEFFL